MTKYKMTKISYVLSYLLVILLLVAIAGVIAYFTNGFTSDFKTFYIEYNGDKILSTSNGHSTNPDKPMQIDVKYTFESVNQNVSGYSIKIIPNKINGKDFNFTVDGITHSFQTEDDLSAGFIIDEQKTSFTVKPKGGINKILQSIYPGAVISDCSNKIYENMFSLIVTSYNGKESITLNFVATEKLVGVTLDKEVIEF